MEVKCGNDTLYIFLRKSNVPGKLIINIDNGLMDILNGYSTFISKNAIIFVLFIIITK
jgi:hypothetical protein